VIKFANLRFMNKLGTKRCSSDDSIAIKIGIKIPSDYGNDDETLFRVTFYCDTLYINS